METMPRINHSLRRLMNEKIKIPTAAVPTIMRSTASPVTAAETPSATSASDTPVNQIYLAGA